MTYSGRVLWQDSPSVWNPNLPQRFTNVCLDRRTVCSMLHYTRKRGKSASASKSEKFRTLTSSGRAQASGPSQPPAFLFKGLLDAVFVL